MQRLWGMLRNLKRRRTRSRRTEPHRQQRRRLFFERLETREVLSAGSIFGTVFDHQSPPAGISGVEVQLTPHGADGVFGNTDDGPAQTVRTATDGGYAFNGLDPGAYRVELPDTQLNRQLLAGLLPPPGGPVETVTLRVIDDFTTTPSPAAPPQEVILDGTAAEKVLPPIIAPEALGGVRDLAVKRSGTQAGRLELRVNPYGGDQLQFDTSFLVRGERSVLWDGDAASQPNYAGLGGLDLTDGGRVDRLQLNVSQADHPGLFQVRVYTDQDNWSETAPLPLSAGSGLANLGFAQDFVTKNGQGADFTRVGAVELTILDGPQQHSLDGQIDFLIPGPSRVNFQLFKPGIDIEKHTNGVDVDDRFDAAIPLIGTNQPVNWTYFVTNTGDVPLIDVVLTDDNGTPADPADDFAPRFLGGDDNGDGALDVNETWRYEASATALNLALSSVRTVPGLVRTDPSPVYENIAKVQGRSGDVMVMDDDPSHYAGLPNVEINKHTNGVDADGRFDREIPHIGTGETVTWTFFVSNTGSTPLSNVVVLDDNGTPNDPSDDFQPRFVRGDVDGDQQLDLTEVWEYRATGTALDLTSPNVRTVAGVDAADPSPTFENMAMVMGEFRGHVVTDKDPSHYAGVPQLDLEKFTNGFDVDDRFDGDIPGLAVGETVTWTYQLTNTGSVPISNIVLIDDNGTPANADDDFRPQLVGGDTDGDRRLDVQEVWQYRATGTALDLSLASVRTVLGLKRSDPVPIYENIAVVTGQYRESEVTDSDPSHYAGRPRIDVEKHTAGVDVDDPFDSAVPLFEAGQETVNWTYFVTNPGTVPLSNVQVSDDNGTPSDPGDDFKPQFVRGDSDGDGQLDVNETWEYRASAPALDLNLSSVPTVDGIDRADPRPTYENIAVASGSFQGETVSDEDPSHYGNPPEKVVIGDYVWIDEDHNGQQGATEPVVPGATVRLIDTSTNSVVGTMTTDAQGKYLFEVVPGTYVLEFDLSTATLPAGVVLSGFTCADGCPVAGQVSQVSDAQDSDVLPTTTGAGLNGQAAPALLGKTGPRTVTVTDDLEIDAGAVLRPLAATVGDRVWFDVNLDGRQDFNDLNSNGIADAGEYTEPGVSGVMVELYSVSGATRTLLQTTSTNSDGFYQFTVMQPQLPGEFQIRFLIPDRLRNAGYYLTKQNVGGDLLDSDADLLGWTDTFLLMDGDSDQSWDAGLVVTKYSFLVSKYR